LLLLYFGLTNLFRKTGDYVLFLKRYDFVEDIANTVLGVFI